MKHYKATRPDGTDFRTGRIDYASALTTGEPVKHPAPVRGNDNPRNYLSISTQPGDCTAFSWPARLFEVAPVGRSWKPSDGLPNKRAVAAVKIVRELPAHELFGPQGEQVVAFLDACKSLTSTQREKLYARPAGWWDTYYAVAYRDSLTDRAGLEAARGALFSRLGGWYDGSTAYGAALALLLRHTIGKKDGLTQAQYNTLAGHWLASTGRKLHPEDAVY